MFSKNFGKVTATSFEAKTSHAMRAIPHKNAQSIAQAYAPDAAGKATCLVIYVCQILSFLTGARSHYQFQR